MNNKLEVKMEVKSIPIGWLVTGNGIEVTVYGSPKWGPNGNVVGKGARNYREEILAAVRSFRDQEKGLSH